MKTADKVNEKTFRTLELNKILAQLATYASFSASEALLHKLEPTTILAEANTRQQETTEARDLLEERSSVTIGGARDIRIHAKDAARGSVLDAPRILEIKSTLGSAAALRRTLTESAERFPLLAGYANHLFEGKRLIHAISQVMDDDGEILDSASPKLMQVRQGLRVAHDRLHTKLQSIINSGANAPYLQEALITMRSGRYVIPIKAEAKGR